MSDGKTHTEIRDKSECNGRTDADPLDSLCGHSDSNGSSSQDFNSDSNIANLRCGYGKWTPDWLQCLNTPRMLLAAVCWFAFTQGFVVNGIIFVNLSAWERLYELRSRQIAGIISIYDFSGAFFTLLFGYLGQFMHNGRILCVGALAMAAGSYTMLLPRFISAPYELGPLPVKTCDLADNATSESCDVSELSAYFWFFIAGHALHAIGGAAVFTLAIPYMDTQIKPRNTPLYIGIMESFAALGPAAGFVLGGLFLKVYVDYGRDTGDIELEPSDPRWVGAWWIGLIFSSSASLTVAAIMACFPRELPSARKHRAEHQTTKTANDAFYPSSKAKSNLKDSLIIIFRNRVWIFLTLCGFVEAGVAGAFGAFLPKIIQFQFNQSPVAAALYTGIVIIPGAALGQILGGIIPKVLNLRLRGLLMQCVINTALGLLLSFQFLIRCDTQNIAGVTVPYFNSSDIKLSTQHPCNVECDCTTYAYDPICGSDNTQYFSPCTAGCQEAQDTPTGKEYFNCKCIPTPSNMSNERPVPSTLSGHGYAQDGVCASDCGVFYLFLALFLGLCLTTFMTGTADLAATVRCVPEQQKALAMAIQSFCHKCASIPSPIIFGLVFDQACLVWQQRCGEMGSCWVYDTHFLSWGFFWMCVLVKSLSCVGFILALLSHNKDVAVMENKEPVTSSMTSLLNDIGAKLGNHHLNSDDDL